MKLREVTLIHEGTEEDHIIELIRNDAERKMRIANRFPFLVKVAGAKEGEDSSECGEDEIQSLCESGD